MTANGTKPTVVEALSAVMAAMPAIGKDSKAPEKMGGYSFRGIEAITRHLQPLLAQHGVIIAPRTTITNVCQSPGMKEGWQDIYLSVEWLVTGPDGSTITAQTTGIGRDNTDKGANKAQSQAFKYLLLQLFCIADAKDDSDGQSYEHDRVQASPPLVSAGNAQNLIDSCVALGLDVAEVVKLGTAGRTDDPAQVRVDEVQAVKEARDLLTPSPAEVGT